MEGKKALEKDLEEAHKLIRQKECDFEGRNMQYALWKRKFYALSASFMQFLK